MNDRRMGYVILALLAAGIIGTLSWVVYVALHAPEIRVIQFDRIGNLSIQDPVSYRGVAVGKIGSMHGVGGKVNVTVQLHRPLKIYRNYEIVTVDKGLMGDRLISIAPGDSSYPEVPPEDTLTGAFYLGISEVLGMAYRLESAVGLLREFVEKMQYGTEDSPSFLEQFTTIAGKIDTLSDGLAKGTRAMNAGLAGELRRLDKALGQTRNLTRRLSTKGPDAIKTIDEQIGELSALMGKLDKLASSLDELVEKLMAEDGLLFGDLAASLTEKVRMLRGIVTDVEEGLFKLRLRVTLDREKR